MERITNLYIPERGILVELPEHVSDRIFCDPLSGRISMDPLEKARIRAIMKDPILKSRYSDPNKGDGYMDRVSPQWRDTLMGWTYEMADSIRESCQEVEIKKYAILSIGSVAKNLSKNRTDVDPSNIDLVVIGEIDSRKAEGLKDEIRSERERITREIRIAESCRCKGVRCSCLESSEDKFGHSIDRVGVLVQDISAVTKAEYYQARMYMSSCAKVIYDPFSVWQNIEGEAFYSLTKYNMTKSERRKFAKNEAVERYPLLVTA